MRPYTLIAELTYRCPLACPYCSNPIDLDNYRVELSTPEWLKVLEEAEALGVVQAHFTGGEPLARRDLAELVAGARRLGLYTNLITSGVPLDRARLESLAKAGLDHVQLSFQDSERDSNDRIAGCVSFDHKRQVAQWVKAIGLPLTINVVLHRDNIDRASDIVSLAESLGADRIELANTQYHGWALKNRDSLLPTKEQLDRARTLTSKAQLFHVKADYFSQYPKACMDGWARRFIVVAPDGVALPCHSARSITTLKFENVRQRTLQWIWRDSDGFNRFRGTDWMADPCKGCDRRETDFGGCRCQSFALTGNAEATDPACSLSPDHQLISDARLKASKADSQVDVAERAFRRAIGGDP